MSRPKSATPSVRKLRKKPPVRDDDSAGGHTSEKKATKKEKSGDGTEPIVKKKKSFIQVINKFSNDAQSPSQGYETDGGAVPSSQNPLKIKKKSKTKNPLKETGYDTDGGYQSENKKSKTRFFKLSTKSSKPDFHLVTNGPVPALPSSVEKKMQSVVPLPIAGRFARTRTWSFSVPSPTTTESAESHVDSSFSQFSFPSFPSANDFSSTTSFSPMSSVHGHQLRPSLSLSSLNHSKPVVSLPMTQDTSPTSTNPPLSSIRSLHSLSVSPSSTSFRSSVSSLQSKKPIRIKIHHPDLPTQQPSPAQTVSSSSGPETPPVFSTTPTLPVLQIPRFAKVRPKNPPIDGFGPRSSLTSDSASLGFTSPVSSPIFRPGFPSPTDNTGGLSHKSHFQENSKRSSQQTIIPSTDYIVPSPLDSPSKPQYSGLSNPPALATYHIPPPSSPAPRWPLPTPPSSCESGESPVRGNSSSGSSESAGQHQVVHLRQKMSKANTQHLLIPSKPTTVATVGDGGGLGMEKTVVAGLRVEKKNGIGSGVNDVPKFQKGRVVEATLSRFAPDDRQQSWIDTDEDTSLEDSPEVEEDHQEVEEPDDLYDILDRFDSHDNENHHSSSSEQALERSHSFKAGKLVKENRYHYPDNSFDARPPSQYVPAAVVAPDLYGFDDDEKSVGDRTSRWSESVYSRSSSSSILDEEESEERRGRLLRRVEAMLDAERFRAQESYIPPVPEIPQAYADIMRKQNGNNDNAGHRSNIINPGRSWIKF